MRENTHCIFGAAPVAVTRHGHTVGYFIPTQARVDADIAALETAGKFLDQLLAVHNVDVQAVVADFKTGRKQTSPGKKHKAAAT